MNAATESRPGRWRATALGGGDAPEMRALFEQVFGTPMSEALWQWKYGHGRGCASGVWQDGSLLTHYGGMRRTLWLAGKTVEGVQMGDVMVRREARGVFSRNGPFAAAAAHFIGEQLGDGKAFAIGFGFPSARHARLGELLGLYRALGKVYELRWAARTGAAWSHWRWRAEPALQTPDTAKQIDALWQQMRSALPGWVLAQRDGAWITHRYLGHPHHHYRIDWLRCRLTRRVAGAIVLRIHDRTSAEPTWEWMDWIGHPRQLPTALAVARATAAQGGARWLQGWFSAPLAEQMMQDRGTSDQGSQHNRVSRTEACSWCVTRHRLGTLDEGMDSAPWWLTSGDTDFR